jgi:LemA protein
MDLTLWIIIGAVVLIGGFLWFAYNSLVASRNRADEAWSDIQVQLKRRHDLIPNLIETVKGYATHERKVFDEATKARTAAINAGNPAAQGQAENMLTDALKSVFAVAEAYPDLKASANFVELQRELSDTENKIQAARRFFNSNIRDFNTKLQSFPTNLIAGMLGFKEREFFQLGDSAEAETPAVSF